MFVLDGSYSVSGANFEIVKQWTKNISSVFDAFNPDKQTKVGVVQYSHYYKNRMYIGTLYKFYNKNNFYIL